MLDVKLIFATIFILVISYTGWKHKSLTIGGAIGAFIVGLSIYIGFSFQGLFLLGSFFASSSLLSKFQSSKKSNLLEMLEKGDQRDIVQVMANGGVPAILSLFVSIGQNLDQAILVGFCISLAAANADTWASEIGTLSKRKPRLLLTFRKVERGTSGAVSLLGTCAAIAGAAFICIIAGLMFSLSMVELFIILVIGFIGNIIDTLLGQTIQIKYKCLCCGKITEKQYHCRKQGEKITNYSFLNNDAVNFLSILFSTMLGWWILS